MATAKSNGAHADVSADEFRASFEGTRVLIQNTWPDVDAAALEATAGDIDKVTQLIAHNQERVNEAFKKQLGDLHRAAAKVSQASKPRLSALEERLEAVLGRLETQATSVGERLKTDVLPLAESKAKANIWRTILIALGLGLVLGLFTSRGARRRG